jgi:hypothetical protein
VALGIVFDSESLQSLSPFFSRGERRRDGEKKRKPKTCRMYLVDSPHTLCRILGRNGHTPDLFLRKEVKTQTKQRGKRREA